MKNFNNKKTNRAFIICSILEPIVNLRIKRREHKGAKRRKRQIDINSGAEIKHKHYYRLICYNCKKESEWFETGNLESSNKRLTWIEFQYSFNEFLKVKHVRFCSESCLYEYINNEIKISLNNGK